MEIAVREAAAQLGIDVSRVRKLLRTGDLAGRQVGNMWLVESADVARLASNRALPGRPLAPCRAWGLLDLLGGGSAVWLSPVARSQVRQLLRGMVGQGADRWRAALRARNDVLRCQAHPAAVRRLLDRKQRLAFVAGPQEAAARGIDLVAVHALPEIYVPAAQWPKLARSLMAAEGVARPNLLVRLPRAGWPFSDDKVSAAALAADLLESAEPRAVAGGVAKLNELAAGVPSKPRTTRSGTTAPA